MTVHARRRVLFSGAAFAVTASWQAAHTTITTGSAAAAATRGVVVVRWDELARRWEKRPAGAPYGVVFLSTNDPRAPAPSDPAQLAGDEWHRHPESVASTTL